MSGFRFPSVLALLLCAISGPALAGGDLHPDGIRPPLDTVLAAAEPDELVPVSVVLKERVDPQRIRMVRAGKGPDEARRAVLDLLVETAATSQARLLGRLRVLEGEARVARIRPLWIGNVVGVDATPAVIREIASRPEVDWVNHNPKVDVTIGRADPDRFEADLAVSPVSEGAGPDGGPEAVECGVQTMGATDVWSEFNLHGDGAVVAVIDSGVCWSHSDIVQQIWVNPGEDLDGDGEVMDPDDENGVDDDGNGHVDDLIGWDFEFNDNEPSDNNSHGSHCAGSVAGDGTAGTQSGMAPDAKVMPVRVGLTFADEVDVWNGMQYAAENGADAISMSLGWPHNQNPDRATWRQNCENTIDAGTAMVIAAGNEGQGNAPDNVRTPGDVPRVITVGAVDCATNAASFTSRGPVGWDGVLPYDDHPYPPGLVKPDVAGTGVGTVSHNICSGYSTKSGTSMATPHVAGAVALMVSANPGLGHDEIKTVLEDTALDLGPAGKDNTYGSGMVNAYLAVEAVFGLSFEAAIVEDTNPSYGNGDGDVDTGELITIRVTLRNQWNDQTASNIEGFITTTTPGVLPVHDHATWPDAAPLSTTDSDAPHFSVRVDQGCNFPIEFKLTLRYNDRESRASFAVPVGAPVPYTMLVDDFESDQGWTVDSTTTTGVFERADPDGVQDGEGNPIQPEDDATPDPGTHAWITGNGDRAAGDDDVDDGYTALVSPPLDGTDYEQATVRYARWFQALPATVPPSDFFRAQWSVDGSTWNDLDVVSEPGAEWTQIESPLPSSAFVDSLRIRFQAEDLGGGFFDSVVEAGIDDVAIQGTRIECDAFVAPWADPPNGVGDSLRMRRVGDDLRFDWAPSPVDASHSSATLYMVYRSASPDAGFVVDGASTETWRIAAGDGSAPLGGYYLVVAENGGGASQSVP